MYTIFSSKSWCFEEIQQGQRRCWSWATETYTRLKACSNSNFKFVCISVSYCSWDFYENYCSWEFVNLVCILYIISWSMWLVYAQYDFLNTVYVNYEMLLNYQIFIVVNMIQLNHANYDVYSKLEEKNKVVFTGTYWLLCLK